MSNKKYTGTQIGYLSLRKRGYEKNMKINRVTAELASGTSFTGGRLSEFEMKKKANYLNALTKERTRINKALARLRPIVWRDQRTSKKLSDAGKNKYPIKTMIKDKGMYQYNSYFNSVKKEYK